MSPGTARSSADTVVISASDAQPASTHRFLIVGLHSSAPGERPESSLIVTLGQLRFLMETQDYEPRMSVLCRRREDAVTFRWSDDPRAVATSRPSIAHVTQRSNARHTI
jgi:hypothetical protein